MYAGIKVWFEVYNFHARIISFLLGIFRITGHLFKSLRFYHHISAMVRMKCVTGNGNLHF